MCFVLGHGQSQRTTQEGSGSGDLANTGTARAYLLARVIATLRGIMEPSGRACCVSSRAGGGRMPACAMREGSDIPNKLQKPATVVFDFVSKSPLNFFFGFRSQVANHRERRVILILFLFITR